LKLKWIIPLLLIFSLSHAVSLTYDAMRDTWELTNSYHTYYINATSGFQLSNVPNEWWSHNLLCARVYAYGSWHEKCTDKLPWAWSNYSDGTFAQLNGTVSYSVGAYSITLKMLYHLDDTDRRIKITPVIINKGAPLPNASIIWRIHDIKINNTPENDYGLVINNSKILRSNLNNTNLNVSFDNLTERRYYLGDDVLGGWAQTWWNENASRNGNPIYNYSYTLHAYHDGTEYNAIIDLEIPIGSMATNEWLATNFWWEDALCGWSCHYDYPTSQVDISEGENYDHGAYITYTGTCSIFGTKITAQYEDNSVWQKITSSTNLSTDNLNPPFLRCISGTCGPASWTITGETAGVYSTRDECYFNSQTRYSYGPAINVTPALHMICTQLGTSKTMSTDENKCYNLTASNIVFDCAGHTLYGNNNNWGIYTDQDNITIKNCHFENYTTTIYLNASQNVNITNSTMAWNAVYSPNGYEHAMGVYLRDANGVTIDGVRQWNFSVDRGGSSGAGGYAYFVYLERTNNTIINNTAHFNNTGDYHSGGGDPWISTCGYGVYAKNDYWNLTVENSTTAGHKCAPFYPYSGGHGVTFSDIVAYANKGGGFTIYSPVTLKNILVDGSVTATKSGIYFGTTVGGSNATNITIRSNTTEWIYGIHTYQGDGMNFVNVSISNATYGLYFDGDAGYSNFTNLEMNDTGTGAYLYGSHFIFENLSIENYSTGLEFILSTDTFVANSTFPTAHDEVFSFTFGSSGVRVLNTSANYSNVTWGSGTSDFTVQWYSRVNVTDSAGAPLVATINVSDAVGNNSYYGDASLTDWFVVNDTKYSTSGETYYNLHNVSANLSGYGDNSTLFNFSYADATVNLTLYWLDVTPPVITLVSPTPTDGSSQNIDWVFVNASGNEDLDSCSLNWASSWYSMSELNSTVWYRNMTSLSDGSYSYYVECNDTSGNNGTSETRTVNIDLTPPTITFVVPTPSDGEEVNQTWVYVNVTTDEDAVSALLNWNGTWYSLTQETARKWYLNITGLENGNYTYNVTANDTLENEGISETRWVLVNYTPPAPPGGNGTNIIDEFRRRGRMGYPYWLILGGMVLFTLVLIIGGERNGMQEEKIREN